MNPHHYKMVARNNFKGILKLKYNNAASGLSCSNLNRELRSCDIIMTISHAFSQLPT